MSKKRGKKRNRSRQHGSTLSQHKRVGKALHPPMIHMLPQDKLRFSSWVNNRLPEVLWAVLAVNFIPRHELLPLFAQIARELSDKRVDPNAGGFDLTHSGLSASSDGIERICDILRQHPGGAGALRPLLLFRTLPSIDRWMSALSDQPTEEDSVALAEAVANCLDHQSQQSTDIRWLTLLFRISVGEARFPPEMLNDLRRYMELEPEHEEMRAIRPSIRAAEMTFRMISPEGEEVESPWCKSFWRESLERTDCVPDGRAADASSVDMERLQSAWFEKQSELVERFLRVQSTTGLDPRIDAVFGVALFAGNVLLEVIHGSNRMGIAGRLLLRSLTECRITLAFLLAKDDAVLWSRYRSYGVGQAKLALLKFDEMEECPRFLSEDSLSVIANEDASEEFVSVDLGHWCNADLRKMAELAGVKNEYDAYYGWSSTFVHGGWAAVRDASLAMCVNPLHRLHRVPRGIQRRLEDVLEDAVGLFNRICAGVDSVYPGASVDLTIEAAVSGVDEDKKQPA
jgi:hypothetical protein